VGFRWYTRVRARALGLAGHVRNLHDGRVEVLASGPPAALEDLETFLREGPTGAKVREVDIEEIPGEQTAITSPFVIA